MRFNLFSRPAAPQTFGRKTGPERLSRPLVPEPPLPHRPAHVGGARGEADGDDRIPPRGATMAMASGEAGEALDGRGGAAALLQDWRLDAPPDAPEEVDEEAGMGRSLAGSSQPAEDPDLDDINALRVKRPWPPVQDALSAGGAGEDDENDAARDGAGRPPSLAHRLAAAAERPPQVAPAGSAAAGLAPPAELRPERHPAALRPEPADQEDDLDDVAVTIGRVMSIRGNVSWGALFDDGDGTTAKAARMGSLVSMRGPESRVFGIVNALQREQAAAVGNEAERTVFEIQMLGEIATGPDGAKGFQRGVSRYPPLDAPVTTVTLRDLAMVYARPRTSAVHVGRLRHNRKVPAFVLTDSLLGKHFAVLGTTGTGKSCAVTVILRAILDQYPQGHVVLLDPHNEYASAFRDKAELLNPTNLQLPYWLLNFEEIAHILVGGSDNEHGFAQRSILKEAILRAKHAYLGGEPNEHNHVTVDTPVPYRLSDVVAALRDAMGVLNKAERSAPFLSLINRLEGLRGDRRFAFMFGSLAVRDNMETILGQLLRIPVDGRPITIIDISGVPSDVVDVVVSVLFRLIFELAVWSERGAAPPVLLVCEEAHRYVPEDDRLGFAPTKRVIARIAKEGRKYGVTLCLVSQRPSEIAINSLSQCNTVFALRLSNEHDQAFVARALPENARWLVDGLPSLNTQEAVVVGDGVTVPVHVRFSDLPAEHRPSSHDPSFSSAWHEPADPEFLGRAIERWRRQAR